MKKFLFILLVCFAAISCNSYDDEIGYIVTTNGTCFQNVISANHTSCKIKYGPTIKNVAGNPKLSKVIFKLSGDGEEVIVDAQKGEDDLYYAEIEIPYDRNITISTVATINGEDVSVCSKDIKYTIMDFAPEFADSIQTNPLNYDVVRYCVNIIKGKNIAFENKILTAKVTFGEKSYPLTFAADGSMYCDINLYDIADFYGHPSLTIKNEIDEYTLKGHSEFEVRKESVIGYDTSEDGKEVDGCIYLAGTKWQKGVLVKGSDGKSYLDINDELGSSIKYEYELDASTTPSLEQAKKLAKYCSVQRVKAINAVENDRKYGIVIYPAKNNEKINSFFYPVKPCKMTDFRNKGLYVKTHLYYGSPKDKYDYLRYSFSFRKLGIFDCESENFGNYWVDCLKMPIKE